MNDNMKDGILRFSVEAFNDLSPDEFALMLLIAFFPGADQKDIKKQLGIGMKKAAAQLRSLRDKGYISYRAGYPETARSSGMMFQDNIGSIPKWVLFSVDLRGASKEKMIYSFLHTFMDPNRHVTKKRAEIEKVLRIKKSTVKHALSELERLGFLEKSRGQRNLIIFKLYEAQKINFFKTLLGG